MDTKPTNKGAIIKPGHSHSDGLQAAYMFNDSGDTVYDWTKNNNALDIVGADIVDEGLKCDADGEYASLDNSNQLISSTKGTIILYFKSLGAIDDGEIRVLIGKYGIASSLGEFAIFKNADNFFYFFLNDGSSHYAYFNNSILPNWQQGQQITFMWDRTASIWGSYKAVLNVDGVNQTPTGHSGITASPPWSAYTIDDPLYIGNDSDSGGTYESNGIIGRCYIYNKVLSVDIIQSVAEKPYDMWIYPTIPKSTKIDYADEPFDKKETLVLNESHAHAQNLVAAYPFKKCYDLRYSYNHDFSTQNNVLDTQPSVINSEGIYCGSATDYSYLNNANEPLNIDEGTIVLEFKNDTSQTLQCLFGRYSVSGAGDFTMMKYSDGNFYFLLNDGTGVHYVYINLSRIPNWSLDFTQIAVLWRRTSAIWNSDNMVINIDGVHVTPDGQLNETSWNTGSLASIPYYIGNNSANANQYASGYIRRRYMYDTVLTEAQLLSIKNDPYAMFED